jgi:hypothetical protein
MDIVDIMDSKTFLDKTHVQWKHITSWNGCIANSKIANYIQKYAHTTTYFQKEMIKRCACHLCYFNTFSSELVLFHFFII